MARRRSFGSIRKHGKRYQARYSEGGKQVTAPHTFTSKMEAHVWLSQLEADKSRGVLVPDAQAAKVLFKDYAAEWVALPIHNGRHLAPRTAEGYRSSLKNYLNPAFGDASLSDITPKMVRDWYYRLRADKGERSTVPARCYSLFRAVLATATRDEVIIRNPCMIRGAGVIPTTERPSIALADVAKVSAALNERYRVMVIFGMWCSLRFGEIVALRRCDIDLKRATVRVERAASEVVGQGRVYKAPKSVQGLRTVAIPPHVLPGIAEHLETFTGPEPDDLVVSGPLGGMIWRSTFTKDVWKPATRAAGVELRFHDLRGAGATAAAQSGATVKELQARLGHASAAMAMRYQRASQDRDRAVAEAMSELALGHG